MARRSEGPRYFPSKNGYFAEINGVRKRLTAGPDSKEARKDAEAQYGRLSAVLSNIGPGDRQTVANILNRYLLKAKTRVVPEPLSPNSYDNHKNAISSFLRHQYEGKAIAETRYCELKLSAVDDWLARCKTEEGWEKNTCRLNASIIRIAFRWAVKQELITECLFDRPGKKQPLPEGDISIRRPAIELDEHELLVKEASRRRKAKSFGLFLQLMYETGARPAEVYKVTANEWDSIRGAFVIDPTDEAASVGRLKTRRHLSRRGKQRIIRVPEWLWEPIKELICQYPEGPLFRTEYGTGWESSSRMAKKFRQLIKRVNKRRAKQELPGVREKLKLYSYRHAYVTRFIRGGGNILVLCELLNTSIHVIQTHYSHLFEQEADLRLAVEAHASKRPTSQAAPQQLPQVASTGGPSSSDGAAA